MSDGRRERLVFVSHSGVDTWVARQIAREIAACGATPFLDEADIDIGSDFEEVILAVLEKCDELVVLITPWALERHYVWAELGAAWGRRIPIVDYFTACRVRTCRPCLKCLCCSRGGTSSP